MSTPPSTQPGIAVPGHVVAEPEPRPRPSIAVVAVHGVADQRPHESAGAVANLLLRITRGGAAAYTSFRELPLRVPTAPVTVRDEEAGAKPERGMFRMEERPAYLQQRMEAAQSRDAPEPPLPADHEFMRSLLAKYRTESEPYETIRLEGQKLGGEEPAAAVHVYEMYWADLSRLGTGVLRIIGELYQLLLQLANLGRVVANHAVLEHPGSRGWGVYAWFQSASVRLLTLFTPVLGMLMLGTLGTPLPGVLPGGKRVAAVAVLAVLGAGAAGVAAYRRRARPSAAVWAALPLAAGALGAGAAWTLLEPAGMNVDVLLALEWMALSAAVLHLLFAAYDRRRPGALFYGWLFMAVTFGVMAPAIIARGTLNGIAVVTLRAFEVQYLVLAGSWMAMAACGLVAGVAGEVLRRRIPERTEEEKAKRGRARRAAWTARTTLALSGTSVFLLSLLVFAALKQPLEALLGREGVTYAPLLGYQDLDAGTPYPLPAVIHELLLASATSGLPVLLVCIGLTMVLAAWAILPAALTEVRPPADASPSWLDPDSGLTREQRWEKVHADGLRSERLGTWLSRGYPTLAGAATLLWVALFVLMPGFSIARAVTKQLWNPSPALGALNWLAGEADQVLVVLGGVIAAAAVGMLALRGRFDVLGMGLRPALDVMLDVENYLRELPRDRTPRARIAERYASLLRYLSLWRDERGQPYAAVILVTHSQGTVITADLLGFLRRERPQGMDDLIPGLRPGGGEPRPGRIRMYLFTMGSPLRQLYGRAFPHLYAWVSGRPTEGFGEPLKRVPTGAAPAGEAGAHGHQVADRLSGAASPDPAQVGLTRWVNAYRSGDYVGRELWRDDRCGCLHRRFGEDADHTVDPAALVVSEDEARLRRELCIGAGAHTHYWDATAPAVGHELDLLLDDVLERVRLDAAAHRQPDARGE